MLTALLASLALIARPVGRAGAATTVADIKASVVYGCGVGRHDSDWVEVTLSQGSGGVTSSSADDATVVQVGLASTVNDQDLYPDGGPTLVQLTGDAVTVRLAGPVASGEHVFVRVYGRSDYRNIALPASCSENVRPTDFGLQDPDIYGNHQVTCAANAASLNLTLKNNNDAPVGYTVLLVRKDGQLAGSQSQGLLISLDAQQKQPVTLTQPATASTIYQYQVRVLSPDGSVIDVADVTMHCDSQQPGGGHPSGTPTPVRPTHTPSGKPSKTPTPNHTPSSTPSHGKPSVTPSSHSSSPAHPQPSSSAAAGGGSGSSGNSGSGGVVTRSSAAGGPVLGDADSTSQPQPTPSPLPSKKTIVEASRLSTVFVNPGFTGAVVLVLLGFAVAMAALLAANQISARRR